MKTPLDVLSGIRVPPRTQRNPRKPGLSYFDEGGDSESGGGTSSDTGAGNPGESDTSSSSTGEGNPGESSAGSGPGPSNGVSDPGESASNAADDAEANAAADANDVDATDASAGYAAQGATLGSGAWSGLDADVRDALNLDSQISANATAPASTMTPAEVDAALTAMSPAADKGAMHSPGVSYADLEAMAALGMGKQDVPGFPGQTVDQALGAKTAGEVLGVVAPAIAGMAFPGFGLLSNAANIVGNLTSGKSTIGETAVSTGLMMAANQLGVPVGVVSGMINGNFGQAAASAAMSALTGAIAQNTGVDPGLVGLGMNASGLGKSIGTGIAGAVNSVTGAPTSSNLGAIAGGLDSALSGMGFGTSGGTTSTGGGTGGSGSSGGGGSDTPGIMTGDFGNIAGGGGTSSGSSGLSGLGALASAAAPKANYRTVGKVGSDMPQKALEKLNLDDTVMPDYRYLTDEDLPMVDVAKAMRAASNLPTTDDTRYDSSYDTLYAAQGGLVQHFAEGDTVAESVKKLEGQYASADMAKALKDLGDIGKEIKPAAHNLRQIGQMGVPYAPKVLPRLAALLQARGMTLAEGGQPSDVHHPNYDGAPVFRTGGLEGLGGKYVEGKGDGTSDDITAMLANGEYVFSADVVSALGNGSNKAGADRLGEMVKAIRERARSAPPDKLPPDAKSPLEYLKSSKGKKNG